MEIKDYPEGATPLDPDELNGLRLKHVTTTGQLNHLEQANLEDGRRWLQRTRNTDLLSERFILDLHKRLFGEVWDWAGTFRRTEKNIGVDPMQISVRLRILLDDTKCWIDNGTYPADEIAIRFHHRLVLIHLFPNGNGRHARILANGLLTKVLDMKPIDWSCGYDLQSMNERRLEYITALREADRGEYRLLLKFARGK